MDEIRLALFLIVVVGCVMLATRPVSNRRRADRSRSRDRASQSSDPLPRNHRGSSSMRLAGRNCWDRTDLVRAIGHDHIDPDGTTSVWPVPAGR